MKTLPKLCPSTIQATSKRVHLASKLCHAHVLLDCVFHKIDVSRLRPSTPYIILIRGTYWKNAPRLAGEGAARGRGGGGLWNSTMAFSGAPGGGGRQEPLEFYHGVFWCPWPRWLSRPFAWRVCVNGGASGDVVPPPFGKVVLPLEPV